MAGKDLIARTLHYHSSRKQAPFVPGNCAALPEQLLADLERAYILLALEWTEGKNTEAADLLKIDRKTLYRKLVEYGKEV